MTAILMAGLTIAIGYVVYRSVFEEREAKEKEKRSNDPTRK